VREKINENPIAQLALIGVLLAVAAFILLKPGGGEEESAATEVTASVNGATATGATPGEAVEGAVESLEEGATGAAASGEVPTSIPAPPPPAPVTAAYKSGA
jgi:hypothetical protein